MSDPAAAPSQADFPALPFVVQSVRFDETGPGAAHDDCGHDGVGGGHLPPRAGAGSTESRADRPLGGTPSALHASFNAMHGSTHGRTAEDTSELRGSQDCAVYWLSKACAAAIRSRSGG